MRRRRPSSLPIKQQTRPVPQHAHWLLTTLANVTALLANGKSCAISSAATGVAEVDQVRRTQKDPQKIGISTLKQR